MPLRERKGWNETGEAIAFAFEIMAQPRKNLIRGHDFNSDRRFIPVQ
ncbi:MAG: hypothetical protein K0Q59_2577 [Paenibacillus sp.]|nr:hypothetical protein [Paenibacillus sp.]